MTILNFEDLEPKCLATLIQEALIAAQRCVDLVELYELGTIKLSFPASAEAHLLDELDALRFKLDRIRSSKIKAGTAPASALEPPAETVPSKETGLSLTHPDDYSELLFPPAKSPDDY